MVTHWCFTRISRTSIDHRACGGHVSITSEHTEHHMPSWSNFHGLRCTSYAQMFVPRTIVLVRVRWTRSVDPMMLLLYVCNPRGNKSSSPENKTTEQQWRIEQNKTPRPRRHRQWQNKNNSFSNFDSNAIDLFHVSISSVFVASSATWTAKREHAINFKLESRRYYNIIIINARDRIHGACSTTKRFGFAVDDDEMSVFVGHV